MDDNLYKNKFLNLLKNFKSPKKIFTSIINNSSLKKQYDFIKTKNTTKSEKLSSHVQQNRQIQEGQNFKFNMMQDQNDRGIVIERSEEEYIINDNNQDNPTNEPVNAEEVVGRVDDESSNLNFGGEDGFEMIFHNANLGKRVCNFEE